MMHLNSVVIKRVQVSERSELVQTLTVPDSLHFLSHKIRTVCLCPTDRSKGPACYGRNL